MQPYIARVYRVNSIAMWCVRAFRVDVSLVYCIYFLVSGTTSPTRRATLLTWSSCAASLFVVILYLVKTARWLPTSIKWSAVSSPSCSMPLLSWVYRFQQLAVHLTCLQHQRDVGSVGLSRVGYNETFVNRIHWLYSITFLYSVCIFVCTSCVHLWHVVNHALGHNCRQGRRDPKGYRPLGAVFPREKQFCYSSCHGRNVHRCLVGSFPDSLSGTKWSQRLKKPHGCDYVSINQIPRRNSRHCMISERLGHCIKHSILRSARCVQSIYTRPTLRWSLWISIGTHWSFGHMHEYELFQWTEKLWEGASGVYHGSCCRCRRCRRLY